MFLIDAGKKFLQRFKIKQHSDELCRRGNLERKIL